MKGLGMSGHLISGRDFRYENFSRKLNIICPPYPKFCLCHCNIYNYQLQALAQISCKLKGGVISSGVSKSLRKSFRLHVSSIFSCYLQHALDVD